MKILLGITGSIAAYKAIDLVKLLQKIGFEITIVVSKSAAKFVSFVTLKALFGDKVYHNTEHGNMLHISLAVSDLILIAPTSANFIASIAHGFTDCLLSNICLTTKAPIMIAPAMNTNMWCNLVSQKNVAILKEIGIEVIGPKYGTQACGDTGIGNMSDIDYIAHLVIKTLTEKLLHNKTVVITVGSTREKLDPVRFITKSKLG